MSVILTCRVSALILKEQGKLKSHYIFWSHWTKFMDSYHKRILLVCTLKITTKSLDLILYIATDFLTAFLDNGSVNTVSVQQWKICLSGGMLLRVARQQDTIEDAV
jgi:hypothetical protein